MIYEIEQMLQRGATFPPKSELERLDSYRVNQMLANDEAWNALPAYKERVNAVLSNFLIPGNALYYYSANYWGDLVTKTQELTYGEMPEVKALEGQEAVLEELLTETEFMAKATEGCEDFVALGQWITKVIPSEVGKDFVNINPSIWFPIVSRENVKDIKAHVLAWIVPVGKTYELHVQVHEKGKYTNRAFAIKDFTQNAEYTVKSTGERIVSDEYTIGVELPQSATDFKLGVFDNGLGKDEFAIIATANNPRTRTVYGTSDFEQITSAAMEYNVRMTLKNVVLDKHSAPKMYGAPLVGDDGYGGQGATGNYLEVPEGGTIPNYLTWDASMQAVENTIQKALDDISNLSGMGSLLNSKTFCESQGYDALMIKLAPALMRSAKKKTLLERHLKKLISCLSIGFGGKIEKRDITIHWHDGIPTTESVRADIAQKHLSTGWSTKRVLMQDYGLTEEDAEMEVEEKRLESPVFPAFGLDEGNANEDNDE